MQRTAFKMYLSKGLKEECKKRHDKIWLEMKKVLKEAGISDFPILLNEETDTLFAFLKVSDDRGFQDLGQIEIVRKRLKHMADIMRTNPDNSHVTKEIEEVFFLE